MLNFSVCQIAVKILLLGYANVIKDTMRQPIKLNVFFAYQIIVKYVKVQRNAKNVLITLFEIKLLKDASVLNVFKYF